MRIILFVLSFLVISSPCFSQWEQYIVEHDDGTVSVHNYDVESSKSLEQTLIDARLEGLLYAKAQDMPKTKNDRKYWVRHGKKIGIDQVKKKDAEDEETALNAEMNAIYAKIGITKDEFEKVKGKRTNG